METAAQFRRQPEPALLADAIANIMEASHTGIVRRYEAASRITEVWAQLLTSGLAEHCRVIDLSGGMLTVEADSPS